MPFFTPPGRGPIISHGLPEEEAPAPHKDSTKAAPGRSTAPRYNLVRDFQATPGGAVVDPGHIDITPAALLAIIPMGRPLTFSRETNRSVGTVVEGAFSRQSTPLLIHDDCIGLSISDSKRSHTTTLQAQLKHTEVNYLDQDVLLPGDWIFAWVFNNEEDRDRVAAAVRRGEPANGFNDGLKFVGRCHVATRDVQMARSGQKTVTYSISAVGFDELDCGFFYDTALATAASVSSDIRTFMAQIGLPFTKWAEQEQMHAGQIRDNCELIITALVDMILGKGVSDIVNRPLERAGSTELKLSPQANKEAPFAFLVPKTVGSLLGLKSGDGTKGGGVFGYADIMQTLIGVQDYSPPGPDDSLPPEAAIFMPRLRAYSTVSRKLCLEKLKGTFLPVNPTFVNIPLWSLLQQFLNPAINEMYTAMKVDETGSIRPTLVVRQIPFSTESIAERTGFKLTRFLSLPRWVLPTVMLGEGGATTSRSNAVRLNMVHVYGDAAAYSDNKSVTNQLVRNPPIFDTVDIQRSGLRAMMRTVNCALADVVRKDGARIWMEAIADWSFGGQYTLNGHIDSYGIQSPIPCGDNLELEGVVYHIESVTHRFGVAPTGERYFRTALQVSNGMPANQSNATAEFPLYPGLNPTVDPEDDPALAGPGDPGFTTETTLKR